ncbi:transcription termination factor Rho, short form [Labedaea rhizosphaerae]|uniref:Transcription termination factor Rho n=1 Tax=Labedaea rhizosphaerae TaxID=598644 RepID=A0A4R6SEP0_LABRH|nr:transcription termination factor Rho [Labedaea rhizosphaerae]TDP98194.1 transcription termination factor Rho [Labedaea rhizosphaerae]
MTQYTEDGGTHVAGILDIQNNKARLRTEGYLPSENDLAVSMKLVRDNGLRRGDAVTGTADRELRTVEAVNGREPGRRPNFTDLTPLYPTERLRLETGAHDLTARVTDLVMPVGKGQRALIVAPPKAGKTTILRSIAHGIAVNHPECHLMLVLVGERPEEVTDLSRAVPAEVIAATFDTDPRDHIALAELAIERAKRLVEQGNDVVVLLDSLTRLGRAYNLAAPTSGRILTGGIDSGALTPPKRFLGAARNIEGGGSLTIFATALVETGSVGDTLIFEEYKGTSNAELRLDRKIAGKRVYPAIDIAQSGTRKEELLLSRDEQAVVRALRRNLNGREGPQAIDMLLEGLRKTRSNADFLAQFARATPMAA